MASAAANIPAHICMNSDQRCIYSNYVKLQCSPIYIVIYMYMQSIVDLMHDECAACLRMM